MKNVIVTGANGYLGKQLVHHLLNDGYFVYAMVRSNPEKPIVHKNIEYLICNIENQIDFSFKHNISCVFHLAWNGAYGEKRNMIDEQFKNVIQDINIINFVKKIKCDEIVYAGSIFEYEAITELENNMHGKASLYSLTKFYSHAVIKKLAKDNGINLKTGIVSNTYGGDIDSQRFIHYCIKDMIKNNSGAYTTAKQQFDVVNIEDAANIFIKIHENGKPFEEYYVGNGEVKPLFEYIELIKSIVNFNYQIEYGKITSNVNEIDYNVFDLNKVKNELGYIMKYDFKNSVKELVRGKVNE